MHKSPNLTMMLGELSAGNRDVLDALAPLVINELHHLAQRHMAEEKSGHTLQATALVNEAYLRLVDSPVNWQDRAHFFALAARQMRRILVDHARAKTTDKRWGALAKVNLEDALTAAPDNNLDLVYLDKLLDQLANFDERAARMFEMRLFSGLSNKEIAACEGLSVATVERDLKAAKSWIQSSLGKQQ